MYTNLARLIILAAALLQWVGMPFSQTAHITGRITDATASVVPAAQINGRKMEIGIKHSTMSHRAPSKSLLTKGD
ncbi:MAG: hypothetical protein L0312_14000, partial [Acidobacteria bacterium]|nr:hypothetical protein [Acidobacteriota bacterium]